MQVTEKFREQILFALPELSSKDAERIASKEECSVMTVYRHFKKLKDFKKGDTLEISSIMVAIGEIAIERKPKVTSEQKRASKIMKQLSAA